MIDRLPICIAGVGDSRCVVEDSRSIPEMVLCALEEALGNAQLNYKDIDAVVISNMELFEGRAMPELWVGEGAFAIGKPCMKIATGGTSGTSSCIAGFHQVASGLFDTVLVVGFEKHSEGHTQTLMALTDLFWDRAVASGARFLWLRMSNPEFDPRTTVLISESVQEAPPPAKQPLGEASAVNRTPRAGLSKS